MFPHMNMAGHGFHGAMAGHGPHYNGTTAPSVVIRGQKAMLSCTSVTHCRASSSSPSSDSCPTAPTAPIGRGPRPRLSASNATLLRRFFSTNQRLVVGFWTQSGYSAPSPTQYPALTKPEATTSAWPVVSWPLSRLLSWSRRRSLFVPYTVPMSFQPNVPSHSHSGGGGRGNVQMVFCCGCSRAAADV